MTESIYGQASKLMAEARAKKELDAKLVKQYDEEKDKLVRETLIALGDKTVDEKIIHLLNS